MGYCMSQVSCQNFLLPKAKLDEALSAIQALFGKETIKDSSGRHFSWVRTNDFMEATSLADALIAWRWEAAFNDDGDIIELGFQGEKLGDDLIMLKAIAPFVTSGEIEMQGEDGSCWKWAFVNGECKELMGRVVYDDV